MISLMSKVKKFSLYLIRASKYDDDGYVLRHWRGVLPSNTLACMYGLTHGAKERKVLGDDVQWKIQIIDESVQKVDVNKITKDSKRQDTKIVVCLVGVQSNQFPRASDLAFEFRKKGVDVLIGGFHVSGSIAMNTDIPEEIKKLIDVGVSVVAGEAEGKWDQILLDVFQGKLKPVYNFLLEPPEINHASLPKTDKKYLQRFISSNYTTLDWGRGCPFNCYFCSVINVHGRIMRCRDVHQTIDLLRENYKKHKIAFYFFTDDNFCRNKNWEMIFDELIKLRTQEKIPIEFMMQVDTQSYKVKHFIDKAKQAGCKHVFIGLESINPKNLQSVNKRQNQVTEFKKLVDLYRERNIDTHIAYIIGFPFDTPESVQQDIEKLKKEIGPEQVSFFVMTPLPGSEQFVQLRQNKVELDMDLNKYDSFHVTMPHPSMTTNEWISAYETAWTSFYSLENMEAILNRISPQNYWDVFMKFIFYKNSLMIDKVHPMLGGIIRLKDRLQKRPGYSIESPFQHFIRRIKDTFHSIKCLIKIVLEMEEVWLRTRPRSLLEQEVVEELQKKYRYARHWRELKLKELKATYTYALLQLKNRTSNLKHWEKFNIPSDFSIWLKQHNFCAMSLTYSRKSFEEFWRETSVNLGRGRIHCINLIKLYTTSVQESYLFINFMSSMCAWLIPHLFKNMVLHKKEELLLVPVES